MIIFPGDLEAAEAQAGWDSYRETEQPRLTVVAQRNKRQGGASGNHLQQKRLKENDYR